MVLNARQMRSKFGWSPGTTALPGQTAGRSQAAAATMVLPRTLASYMA